jgi:hypothetical protein
VTDRNDMKGKFESQSDSQVQSLRGLYIVCVYPMPEECLQRNYFPNVDKMKDNEEVQ